MMTTNSNSFLSLLDREETQRLRFIVGLVVSVVISFGFNWPFAFIMPVFVAKFLASPKPPPSIKTLLAIFIIIVSAVLIGGLITKILLPYPVVFILMMTLAIFWISYWSNSGGNELVITMLLICTTAIPMLGLIGQQVPTVFAYGFLFSCFSALLITFVMNTLFPVHGELPSEEMNDSSELAAKHIRVKFALLSTIMIVPVIIFFFTLNLTGAILIMVFVAIMAQNIDLVSGIKGSKALLVGNTMGGVVAIAVYALLILVPSFSFLILLMALVFCCFAQFIFSKNPLAPLFAMALGTVIILVSSATLGDADASEKFYTRIFQIAAACFYIIFTTIAATPIIEKISKS
ncbi:MAG: DUF2955 domain-containing protein [Colwellia sp.]